MHGPSRSHGLAGHIVGYGTYPEGGPCLGPTLGGPTLECFGEEEEGVSSF